jgi:putative radical SAM enzyme (TIGR03279 family)
MSRDEDRGVKIVTVDSESEAYGLGLREGDRILSISREAVEDALDVHFLLSINTMAELEVLQSTGSTRRYCFTDPEELLHEIELEPLDVWRCTSDCIYCFCKQNPPGARPSLFFRDEDFRMSFLSGSYTTMATATDAELNRITRQRLSPQYLTIPSTNEQVRRYVLGVKRARPITEVLETLREGGIELHVQIVVVPEVNDGPELDATIGDLHGMRETIRSVAVVPVGTTRYTKHPAVRRHTQPELRHLLSQVRQWQRVPLKKQEGRWIEAADEVYLALELGVPAARTYGTFPQLTTGVGMTRLFLDDASRLRRRRRPSWWGNVRLAVITGELFAPTMRRVVASLSARFEVIPVPNKFFGTDVTVSGLLGGREVEASVQAVRPDAVFLPENILDESETRFVDDTLFADLERRLKPATVIVGGLLSECATQLTECLS